MLTEDNDVEDQDNKTDDSSTGTVLPAVSVALSRDWGGRDKREHEELEQHGESSLKSHSRWCFEDDLYVYECAIKKEC